MLRRVLCFVFVLGSTFPLSARLRVEPQRGFPWGGNFVILTTDVPLIAETVRCDEPSPCGGGCPASVTFGGVSGEVIYVSQKSVGVVVPPHAAGYADVRLHIEGLTDLVAPASFLYMEHLVADSASYERVLVPVTVYDLHGAQGSLWRSELTVLNDSEHPVMVPGLEPQEIAPHRAMPIRVESRPPGLDGAFVSVPRGLGDELAMQLRVRDVSREAEGWGTEVPVVREEQFAESMELVDVPTDARYRATLRVYGEPFASQVRVTIYEMYGDRLIEERVVGLQPGDDGHPAYAQLDPLTAKARAAGDSVRIRLTLPAKGWGFVSITNNDTQQVTTVTPQRRHRS